MIRSVFMIAVFSAAAPGAWAQGEAPEMVLRSAEPETLTVVNTATGETSPVIVSQTGEQPVQCPDEAYWSDLQVVVRCSDGAVFIPADENAIEFGQDVLLLPGVQGGAAGGTGEPPVRGDPPEGEMP